MKQAGQKNSGHGIVSHSQPGQYAWSDAPEALICTLAFGDLINNLTRCLTLNGKIHAPTLLVASAALAGYAAQRAVIETIIASNDTARKDKIQMVTIKSGKTFCFGEPIDEALLPLQPSEKLEKLWSLACGAAISAGLRRSELPEISVLAAQANRAISEDYAHVASVSEDQLPHLATRDALKLVWPLALHCFDGKLSAKDLPNGAGMVPQRWRPVIAAVAVNNFMQQAKGFVPPLDALKLVMETAIYASKLEAAALA